MPAVRTAAAMNLRTQSRRLFPTWNRHMRAKWVLAKAYALNLPQRYGKMLPMTMEQIPRQDQFTPRTMREAGFQ